MVSLVPLPEFAGHLEVSISVRSLYQEVRGATGLS